MKIVETILVALIVLGALAYLYKTFRPKGGCGCGCGATDCKVPKPKLSRKASRPSQTDQR